MSDHHHGYVWLGSGHELAKDGPRRPAHGEFAVSRVPPLELAHWLLKPASFVEGTWRDPGEAAAWWGGRVRAHADALLPHDRQRVAARAEAAVRAVAGGEDVAGGWWLAGGRFLSVCLIGCSPHRFRPECRCPIG